MMTSQPDRAPEHPSSPTRERRGGEHVFWRILRWLERLYLVTTFAIVAACLLLLSLLFHHGVVISHHSPYVNAVLSHLTGWHWLSGSVGAVAEGSTLRLWVKDLSLARSDHAPLLLHSSFATCSITPLSWLRQGPLLPELRLQDLVIRLPRPEEPSASATNNIEPAAKNHDLRKVRDALFLVLGLFHDPFPVGQMVLSDVSIRMSTADAATETEVMRIQDWVLRLERKANRPATLKADGHIAWRDRLAVIKISGTPDANGGWGLHARLYGLGLPLLIPLFPELRAWEGHHLAGDARINARFDPDRGGDLQATALVSHTRGKIPVRLDGQLSDHGTWRLEASLAGLRLADFRERLGEFAPVGELTAPLNLKAELRGGKDVPFTATWRLEAGTGSLTWRPLFRWSFPITRFLAQGSLGEKTPGLWQLAVTRFHLRNSQGEARGEFALRGIGGPEPLLDLRAEAGGVPTDQ
ncbi:MAG: hypothetical protein HQL66_10870, partial [Magnetococcales bacterium]|nr:hypothetical protein [Magnetococcales bacterium]